MTTLLVYAPALEHTRPNHPENHTRIGSLLSKLEQFGVLGDLTAVSPITAAREQISRVHTSSLIERIRQTARRGGGLLDHGDTYATPHSYELARLAAGGVCTVVDAIMTGAARNGIALVRPPGHHAESNRVTGFCLFNNVAVAARHAQAVHNAKRILILDYDVHHGNGTQEIFYHDQSVLFISTHLFIPRFFYPGSGSIQEIGQGSGAGYTVNVPLFPEFGDAGYLRIINELVRPKIKAFQPDLMLISAGFDAHWQDPLAMAGMSLTGYARTGRALVEMADELCHGRILFVLEGGYHLEALTYGILNVIYALLKQDKIHDPLGPMPHPEQDVTHLLQMLKERHLLF